MKKHERELMRIAEQEGLAVLGTLTKGRAKHPMLWLRRPDGSECFSPLPSGTPNPRMIHRMRQQFRRLARGAHGCPRPAGMPPEGAEAHVEEPALSSTEGCRTGTCHAGGSSPEGMRMSDADPPNPFQGAPEPGSHLAQPAGGDRSPNDRVGPHRSTC